MIELDFNSCVWKPYKHQAAGVKALIQKPFYGLFWEMRLGKTKAIVDTACFLRRAGLLDAVIIACPAQVKDVWGHKEIGEIKKHAFEEHKLIDLASRNEDYADIIAQETRDLLFLTINHELLRAEDARGDFPRVYALDRCMEGKKVWVVLDEGAAFSNHKSLQTKSALQLSRIIRPSRRTLLDGTPIGNNPIEQYSKFKVLDERILGYKNFFHFRAVHQSTAVNKFAARGKAYVGFKNQELIDKKVKAHCEYVAQKDALDMPKKVPSFLTVPLGSKAWRIYCEMRDELVAELDSGKVSAQHAAVKSVRLAQICAGFVGGVENETTGVVEVREISDETCKAMVEWSGRKLDENPNFKTVLWCRFQPEIERLVARLSRMDRTKVCVVYGKKKDYNDELHPDSPFMGSLILVAQPQALRYGVNLSKADNEAFVSQDYNRVTRAQAEDRIQPKEGVRGTSLVIDVLVTGPNGQKTVTWDIKKVLEDKAEVATRTTQEWKRILLEE